MSEHTDHPAADHAADAITARVPDAAPPPPPAPGTAAAGAAPRHRLILAVLATATFLGSLDLLAGNVALDPIGRAIGEANLSNLSWLLNAFAIVFAALLVPAGRLGDRYGLKSAFLVGLGLFAAASLGAALSSQLWLLIVFRVLQAAGAATLTPASLGLVLATSPVEKAARNVQVWAASGSLAAATGPVLGGVLASVSWRLIFLVNLLLCLAALLIAARQIPHVRHDPETRIPDLSGGLLIVVAIGSLALGLVEAPAWGWDAAPTIIALAVALAAAAGFVARSAGARVPMIDLRLFASQAFSAGTLAVLLFYAAFVMQLLGLVQWFEQHAHWTVIGTGLAVAPGPCLVFAASVLAQRLASRLPASVIAAIGTVLSGIVMRTWLVRSADRTIRVDTGVGNGVDRPNLPIHAKSQDGLPGHSRQRRSAAPVTSTSWR